MIGVFLEKLNSVCNGLMHEKEDEHKVKYWFGRGHHWTGSDTNLYASILGGKNGKKRVNRYSNPELEYMGASTGIEDSVKKDSRDNANNAKVLMWNREALSRVGDESQECPGQTNQGEKQHTLRYSYYSL